MRSLAPLAQFALIPVCLALSGCAADGADRVSPEELYASIQTGIVPTIVDVRTASEYQSGHVPGAVHVPFYSMWTAHPQMPSSKEEKIVVYCAHGPRAGLAKLGLWAAGYDNVLYLDGHMARWKKQGLPLETGAP